MSAPLIELRGVSRRYPSGEGSVTVLDEVSLTIEQGELVAIIGASGSGKSTLLNILGCLDRPSSGEYRVAGQSVATLTSDDLADLRRDRFGFIFQRYHLLGEIDAVSNVEIPAVYAGLAKDKRNARAAELLSRLGMADRVHHRPSQLSGGQQQRVSIARALMNQADVILADEPTGALDSHSGEEVLRALQTLNSEGRTIVLVTHDPKVAARADRVIEIRDGKIARDTRDAEKTRNTATRSERLKPAGAFVATWQRFREAVTMALRSMNTHRMRALLTMLGIIIGTASVVLVIGLGQGARNQVLAQIAQLGTNALYVQPSQQTGTLLPSTSALTIRDAESLSRLAQVQAASPVTSSTVRARSGSQEIDVAVSGVDERYFETLNLSIEQGALFGPQEIRTITQTVLLDANTKKALFPDESGSVLGHVIFFGNMPARVTGVVASTGLEGGDARRLTAFMPYTTVQTRMKGTSDLDMIVVRLDPSADSAQAETTIRGVLAETHPQTTFQFYNTANLQRTIEATAGMLSLLVGSIAAISLVVGGIGVMNIMLASVSERINEIGVRMAIGARRGDIRQQFLIEALLVCFIGGTAGVALAVTAGAVFSQFDAPFEILFSPLAVILALLSSCLIGIAFGFMPARNASNLDPVTALARD